MGLKLLHTTWSDVQRLCEKVAHQIERAAYSPELIVAVSRGGFPPSRILCDLLDVGGLASMKIEYYASVQERRERPSIVYPLNADVRGKRVLIVDDVADSGHSLALARRHVLQRGAREVRIATLHYKPWSVVKPDFYAEETDAWVVYVWERRETIRQFLERLRDEGMSEREAREQLIKMGFKEDEVSAELGRGVTDPQKPGL